MLGLEDLLRNNSRTQARLNHERDVHAAHAAVKFFARGDPSPNARWYGPETWRQIMEVFAEIAAVSDREWRESENNDPGTLRTHNVELRVGQVIEIEGEGRRRYVTSTMGWEGKFQAHFKNQGVVPQGKVRWRFVASAPPVETSIAERVDSEPTRTPPAERRSDRRPAFEGTAGSAGQYTATLWERVRRHPVAGALVFLGAVVAGLGGLTDSLDKVIQFVKKYLGI